MKKIFYLIALAGIVLASCAKPDNNPNKERLYSFSISAERAADSDDTDDSSKTRIELINDILYWSIGDNIGLSIYKGSSYYDPPIVALIEMTSDHQEPTKYANFKGHLTYDQISQFNSYEMYHYNATFPRAYYDISYGSVGCMVGHLANYFDLKKNEFPLSPIFMYAQTPNCYAMTWLDENGEQQFGERPTLHFRHAFSYLRLRLDSNLTGENVTRIEMNSMIGTDLILSGMVYVHTNGDPTHGNYNGDNEEYVTTRVMDIVEGGFNIGNEIFIPMIPQEYPANSLKFKFTFTNGGTYEIVIPSYMNLEAGKIHPIGFNIPSI